MQIRNAPVASVLCADLQKALEDVRKERRFDPHLYIEAKATLINAYLTRFGLKSCVVAVSGGIDSAVVLGLVQAARRMPGSPIERVVAVLLPVYESTGVTGQADATARGREVCQAFGVEPMHIPLKHALSMLTEAVEAGVGIEGGDWAEGQVASYLRTPALYYVTSLLVQEKTPGVLVGTTNRDEGGYIGYIGKASDGMVDVQPISDLHKSEVRQVAAVLGVPTSVQEVAPTGDMFDGKTDEEVFGFPYDFLEFYQAWLSFPVEKQEAMRLAWSDETLAEFDHLSDNVEKMHRYNHHKYLGRSPAVHLDAMEAAVPGGWDNRQAPVARATALTSFSTGPFVNAVTLPETVVETLKAGPCVPPKISAFPTLGDSARRFERLLCRTEVDVLRAGLPDLSTWTPVGVDGYLSNYKAGDAIGSWRASVYSEELAEIIYKRIQPALPPLRVLHDHDQTDHEGHPVWRPIGVNPLLRFIAYTKGGLLVPHYDGPYVCDDRKRTLMTLVIYLSDAAPDDGGATRFIRDPQAGVQVDARDLGDWAAPAKPEDVRFELVPAAGTGMIWDHRILHDSSPIATDSVKMILRTDVVFERCDWWA